MSLIKYNPITPFRSMDKLFDRFMNIDEVFGSDFTMSQPSVNIIENEGDYRIEVAAPGLEKADFDVKVDKDMLVISAEKETKTEEGEKDKYMRREFSYTSFERRFQLPEHIKADEIKANYENGVLMIRLPKQESATVEQTRVIDIR